MILRTNSKADEFVGVIGQQFKAVDPPKEKIIPPYGAPEQLGTVTWLGKKLMGPEATGPEAQQFQRWLAGSIRGPDATPTGVPEKFADPRTDKIMDLGEFFRKTGEYREEPIYLPQVLGVAKTGFPSDKPGWFGKFQPTKIQSTLDVLR